MFSRVKFWITSDNTLSLEEDLKNMSTEWKTPAFRPLKKPHQTKNTQSHLWLEVCMCLTTPSV